MKPEYFTFKAVPKDAKILSMKNGFSCHEQSTDREITCCFPSFN